MGQEVQASKPHSSMACASAPASKLLPCVSSCSYSQPVKGANSSRINTYKSRFIGTPLWGKLTGPKVGVSEVTLERETEGRGEEERSRHVDEKDQGICFL